MRVGSNHAEATTTRTPLHGRGSATPHSPGFMLGAGLGGFVDGIVLHQILQWHHLLTAAGDFPMNTVEGLEGNTVADGLFHAATWVIVFTGAMTAFHAWRRGRLAPPWRHHVGSLLIGWGVFNVVEGIVNHQILGIHHVRDDLGGPLSWDIGFLALGGVVALCGALLMRSGTRPTSAAPGPPPILGDR